MEVNVLDPPDFRSLVSTHLPVANSGYPVAIGPARDGFVVAWNVGLDVRVMHVVPANGMFLATGETRMTSVPGFPVVPAIRAANDLAVFNVTWGISIIDSTLGRLSLDGENASSPDVLWLGGSRYLVAYLVSDLGVGRIELLTIDVSRRRAAR
jgi:hypothetical protein